MHPEIKNYYSDSNMIFDKQSTTLYYSFGATDLSKIPKSVTTINSGAFIHNTLETIQIPRQITVLNKYAFACSQFREISFIDNEIKAITWYCFYLMANLSSIDLPKSVEKIDTYAFLGCRNLSQLIIPKSVTEFIIGYTLPIDIIILNKDISISVYSSYDNFILFDIKFELRNYLYYNKGLFVQSDSYGRVSYIVGYFGNYWDGFDIPKWVDGIKENAFKSFNGTYINCPLNSELVSIENNAFDNCTNLLSIPNSTSLQTIGENAFRSCKNLACVILPKTIISIGKNAFADCKISCFEYQGNNSSMLQQIINSGISQHLIKSCRLCNYPLTYHRQKYHLYECFITFSFFNIVHI